MEKRYQKQKYLYALKLAFQIAFSRLWEIFPHTDLTFKNVIIFFFFARFQNNTKIVQADKNFFFQFVFVNKF